MDDYEDETQEPSDDEVEAYHQDRASGEPPLTSEEIARRMEDGRNG